MIPVGLIIIMLARAQLCGQSPGFCPWAIRVVARAGTGARETIIVEEPKAEGVKELMAALHETLQQLQGT